MEGDGPFRWLDRWVFGCDPADIPPKNRKTMKPVKEEWSPLTAPPGHFEPVGGPGKLQKMASDMQKN